MNTALFIVWPYLALTVFVVGHVWRWRQDQFGWGSRTSELMEKRWLMVGSPLFHLGALMVVAGHVLGLLVPASLTERVGLSEHMYHLAAVGGGVVAGTVFLAGAVILGLRRYITKARFRLVTRPADAVMYVVLLAVGLLGMGATVGLNLLGDGYDYRGTIAVWFRSLATLNPRADLMVGVPLVYQIHVSLAFLLVALWPFTRLVHVWSIPLGYLARPPIVYHRSVPEKVR